MNITDLIVELLQQGKNVEIPGIGTLRTEMQAAHHDPRTHTYYPARRVVAYSDIQSGNNDLVAVIAKKECVNEEIAEMMLKNYVSALDGKLQREGCHTFANIGTLTKNESGFGFRPDSNFGVEKNNITERPIEHINTYTPKKADPFAAFEKPAETTEETTNVVPAPEEAPAPIAEPEPVAATPAEEQSATKNSEPEPAPEEHEPIQQEPEPVEVAPEPEPETTEPSQPIQEPVPTETEQKTTASSDDTNELLQQLDAIPDAPKTVEKEEKKKKNGWLWFLIILLLLLIGAGAYYYFVYMPAHQPAPLMEQVEDTIVSQVEPNALPEADTNAFDAMEDSLATNETDTVATEESDVAVETESATPESIQNKNYSESVNIFTFSTDRIGYTTEEIADLSKNVREYMSGYLENHLSAEGYSAASEALMDSVERYANQRLGELLDNNKYCVQNFIPYNDYIHNYIESDLKANKAHRACVKVQTEIMDASYLAPMVNSIIDALQLEPATVAKPKTTATAPKQAEPNYSNVNFASQSKKGFDIIAGFFKNKSGAAKLTQSLKAQGCDAYVISTSNGHYVSMGSTSNRTQADAMYNHIKSWYSGDVVIKQW